MLGFPSHEALREPSVEQVAQRLLDEMNNLDVKWEVLAEFKVLQAQRALKQLNKPL